MMRRMKDEMAGREPQVMPQIDSLLILDRTVDLLSPLLSQLTYEGLIDEIFGINNSKLQHSCWLGHWLVAQPVDLLPR